MGSPAIVEHIHRNAVILGGMHTILFLPAQLAGGQGQVLLSDVGGTSVEGLGPRDRLAPVLGKVGSGLVRAGNELVVAAGDELGDPLGEEVGLCLFKLFY